MPEVMCKDSHMITGFGNLLIYATVFIGPEVQRGTSGQILSLTVHKLTATTAMLWTMRAAPAQFYLQQLRVVTARAGAGVCTVASHGD